MLFNSIEFLIFFPVICILYFIIPHRVRYIWLLIASYYFYMCWNAKYAILLIISTVITYLSGLFIAKTNHKKLCVALSFIINLAILVFFKYSNFLIENINSIVAFFGIDSISNGFDIVLPVGISFYTFQALSYTVDVYRNKVEAQKNILKYALFVSFFPQLVAGPIERSTNLLKQVSSEMHFFDYDRIKDGLLLMGWGFFQKIVIADRLALIVNQVYGNYQDYSGFALIIATFLFSIQIYCDFSSYSDIAIGASQVMGFRLMKNFETPYFSKSVTEFWKRWHISLTSWFKDYLYIPLGGNRKGKLRKYINILIVFLVSGIWHGANWTFVIWGALNGIFQILEDTFKVVSIKYKKFHYKLLSVIFTFILINITWVFFRAKSINDAFLIIKQMVFHLNPEIFINGTLFKMGMDKFDFIVMNISLSILLTISIFKYKKLALRKILSVQPIWIRWIFYFAIIYSILIFGVYGPEFENSQFIYFQF